FQWIERTFGLAGLLMGVFAVSAVVLRPDWNHVARGLIPSLPSGNGDRLLLYAYFAVGIFSAVLMGYEVHFYSSVAIEEDWTSKDLGENFLIAALGSVFGGILSAGLLILAVLVFLLRDIFPQMLSTTIMTGALPFGRKALLLTLLGTVA